MNFSNPWVVGIGVGVIIIIIGLIIDVIKIAVKKRLKSKIKHEVITLEKTDLTSDVIIHKYVPQAKEVQIIELEQEDLPTKVVIHDPKHLVPVGLNKSGLVDVEIKNGASTINTPKSKLEITPKTILDDIKSAPPLRRDTVAENYTGIKVAWDAYVVGGYPRGDREYFIFLGWKEDKSTVICCYVDVTKYPELKVIKEQQLVNVQGEIESIRQIGDVMLKNCTFTFK